jgi:hypothetical protein
MMPFPVPSYTKRQGPRVTCRYASFGMYTTYRQMPVHSTTYVSEQHILKPCSAMLDCVTDFPFLYVFKTQVVHVLWNALLCLCV